MNYTEEALVQAVEALGWDVRNDDIRVEIGGTSVYEIDGAGTKWAPVKGLSPIHISEPTRPY